VPDTVVPFKISKRKSMEWFQGFQFRAIPEKNSVELLARYERTAPLLRQMFGQGPGYSTKERYRTERFEIPFDLLGLTQWDVPRDWPHAHMLTRKINANTRIWGKTPGEFNDPYKDPVRHFELTVYR